MEKRREKKRRGEEKRGECMYACVERNKAKFVAVSVIEGWREGKAYIYRACGVGKCGASKWGSMNATH